MVNSEVAWQNFVRKKKEQQERLLSTPKNDDANQNNDLSSTTMSAPTTATTPESLYGRRPHILLGVTGSIAAVKGPRLALRLANELKANVKVVLTRTVEQYFWKEGRAVPTYDRENWIDFESAVATSKRPDEDEKEHTTDWKLTSGRISIHYAEEEWNDYKSLSDSVLHIDLRNWADICVVAPLSAHTLGKIANGLCDDLLTCILRAWDFGNTKPIVLAPAMNTAMWEHPLTNMQLKTVKSLGREEGKDAVVVVQPVAKTLACGEVGVGALAELDDIISTTKQCLTHMIGNKTDISSLSNRKDSMRRALLKLAKDRFREMQSTHQIQLLDSNLAAPISPTPNLIIKTFLPHLKLDSSKLMVDLGCGDGRWLLAASKLTQCRSFGIDLDEDRLKIANQSITEQSLDDRIEVQRRDVFDFVKNDAKVFLMADVFVLYLFRDAMVEMGKLLQERLCQQKKSVCVLSIGFALTGWKPSHEQRINGLKVYLYNTRLNST